MSKPCCENCKYWTDKSGFIGKCLALGQREGERQIVIIANYQDSPSHQSVKTPMNFGCNAFEEKPREPFYADRCCGIDEHEWAVGILPGHIIIDHIPEIRAKRLAERLNMYWLDKEGEK